MYNFYRSTGGSLHYGKPSKFQFSIFGKEITLPELKRASLAYWLADNYLRTFSKTKRRYILNQAMFIELSNNPRNIITLMLRKKQRDGFSMGQAKIKEVIDLTEQLVTRDDWKFDLGLKIVELFVDGGWCPRARSFLEKQGRAIFRCRARSGFGA